MSSFLVVCVAPFGCLDPGDRPQSGRPSPIRALETPGLEHGHRTVQELHSTVVGDVDTRQTWGESRGLFFLQT